MSDGKIPSNSKLRGGTLDVGELPEGPGRFINKTSLEGIDIVDFVLDKSTGVDEYGRQ
jgi:hypothetical protein